MLKRVVSSRIPSPFYLISIASTVSAVFLFAIYWAAVEYFVSYSDEYQRGPYLLTILIMVLLAIVFLGNLWLFLRLIIPVHRLTKKAEQAAEQDFPAEFEQEKGVALLGRLFNKTIAQVRTFNQMNIDRIIDERRKLEHIIEQLAGGILIVSPENKILICNNVLAEWYKLDKGDIINKKLSQLNELDEYNAMVRELNWEKSDEVLYRTIYLNSEKGLTNRVLQASATNIFTTGRTFLGTSIYIRDITKEHEIDQLKSELMSIVAHELRSPLVSIIGFSEMLVEERSTTGLCKEYLNIINSESTRLSEFVDNFLDLTRIESGEFTLNNQEANFITTVKQVIDLYLPQAKAKNTEIKTDFQPPIIALKYDIVLVERAIGNYLSNAIKYNPPGTDITVKTFIRDQQVHLEIIDNGIGISKENIDKVFNKFFRVPAAGEGGKKGSGLGLSFVKLVIEKHGGKVYLSSKPNKGSTFGFTLPADN